MQTVMAPRGDARTFLTHFVGGGLDDDRYAVQWFHSLAGGDIVPVQADGTKPKGHRHPCPAQYHPGTMPALLVNCYANGIFGSRRIASAAYRDTGVRYLGDTPPPCTILTHPVDRFVP